MRFWPKVGQHSTTLRLAKVGLANVGHDRLIHVVWNCDVSEVEDVSKYVGHGWCAIWRGVGEVGPSNKMSMQTTATSSRQLPNCNLNQMCKDQAWQTVLTVWTENTLDDICETRPSLVMTHSGDMCPSHVTRKTRDTPKDYNCCFSHLRLCTRKLL